MLHSLSPWNETSGILRAQGTQLSKPSLANAVFTCPSCGTKSNRQFCCKCGEKELSSHDYSIRHYLNEFFSALTALDSKVFRSIWVVVSKPGFLSCEYFKGRRVRYMKPLQLFVFLNVIYYLSISIFYATTFTTPLETQLHMNNYYPAYAEMRVQEKLQKEQIGYAALETKYNRKTNVLSKTLIFLLIPVFAILFYALFFRKRKYLVEHVVIATHFWCFNLVLLGVFLPVASTLLMSSFKIINLSTAFLSSDNFLTISIQILLTVYLFMMMRRVYATSNWYCALSAIAIATAFFHLVWLYRFMLFEVTLSVV